MIRELKVSVNDKKIELESSLLIDEIRYNFTRKIMDTEDSLVREALIKLGWIPPSDYQEPSDNGISKNKGVKMAGQALFFDEQRKVLVNTSSARMADKLVEMGLVYICSGSMGALNFEKPYTSMAVSLICASSYISLYEKDLYES